MWLNYILFTNKGQIIAVKLLVNAEAGVGKTSLIASFGEETFVVSRDAKDFTLPIPHMMVDKWYNMETFTYGADVKDDDGNMVHIDGIADKITKYHAHYGVTPTNVVIDAASQIWMDVIEKASLTPNNFGSQGMEVTKEIGLFVKFIHEFLELNGVNVILLNHIIPEKIEGTLTGVYIPFGSGKFLQKGAFFSTVSESITLIASGENRAVYTNSLDKMARTSLTDLPAKMWVENIVNPSKSKKLGEGEEYFTLKGHLEKLTHVADKSAAFRI